MGSEQVAQVLRKVGQHVKLVIARLVADDSTVEGAPREEVFSVMRLTLVNPLSANINVHFLLSVLL